jgi:hypothetical protein
LIVHVDYDIIFMTGIYIFFYIIGQFGD